MGGDIWIGGALTAITVWGAISLLMAWGDRRNEEKRGLIKRRDDE